jgi:hypothetical protein
MIPEPSAAYNLLWEAISGQHDTEIDAQLSLSAKMVHQLSSAVTFSYASSDRGQATDPESGATDPAEPEESLLKVIGLPFSHVFHSACLVPWFSQARPKETMCPTCRFKSFNADPGGNPSSRLY